MALLTDLARLCGAKEAAVRIAELAPLCDGAFGSARAGFVTALAEEDPDQLLAVTGELTDLGAHLLAAEAANAAAVLLARAGRPRRSAAAAARSAANAQRCEGARSPALTLATATAPLTGREREVALLAAKGVPTKDIATQPRLSDRTVDNHLQRVYAKLGIAGRRQLAERLDG
ncbi:helix-turn-helix transcriptional regulator [Kitasatospora sp. NPDC085879]|uniref:helix-turn-helix transcriptional regulator n=1 Tax=Kitasatospora sp. NPDC085879 TaxID=3154769 RepID=UPI0034337C7A